MSLRITVSALVLLALTSCESPSSGSSHYTNRLQQLENLVAQASISPGGDYWLVKATPLGSDPVALIFGFPNNHAFCQELAESQNQLYPGASVTCEPAQL